MQKWHSAENHGFFSNFMHGLAQRGGRTRVASFSEEGSSIEIDKPESTFQSLENLVVGYVIIKVWNVTTQIGTNTKFTRPITKNSKS